MVGFVMFVIMFLFLWAVIHGGTRKKMPPLSNFEQHDEV